MLFGHIGTERTGKTDVSFWNLDQKSLPKNAATWRNTRPASLTPFDTLWHPFVTLLAHAWLHFGAFLTPFDTLWHLFHAPSRLFWQPVTLYDTLWHLFDTLLTGFWQTLFDTFCHAAFFLIFLVQNWCKKQRCGLTRFDTHFGGPMWVLTRFDTLWHGQCFLPKVRRANTATGSQVRVWFMSAIFVSSSAISMCFLVGLLNVTTLDAKNGPPKVGGL